jgi:hypothetical protein
MILLNHFSRVGKELERLHPGRTFGLSSPKIVAWTRDHGWGNWPVRMMYGRLARKYSCDILDDPNARTIRFKRR